MIINERINSILRKQRKFFDEGNTFDVNKRIEWLKILKQSIKDNEKDLIDAIKSDLGRSELLTKAFELDVIYREIDEFIEKLPSWVKDEDVEPTQHMESLGKYSAKIVHIPHGQVYMIVPFNFPIVLGLSPLSGAIAGGNVTFYKTSKYTPSVNAVVKRVLSNLPEELVFFLDERLDRKQVDEINDYLWDFIFFTGSTMVGAKIYEHQYHRFIPSVFELGGKSPMLIDDTADLEWAARKFISTKLMNAGQICIAVDYLIIKKNIEQKFSEVVKDIYEKEFKNNDLYKSNIITKDKSDEVDNWIKNEDQSKFIIKDFHNIKGYDELKFSFISYDDVKDKKYLENELFSPISYYYTFETIEDVLSIIKKHDFPLAFYCFSKDDEFIKFFEYHTQSGSFVINDVLVQFIHSNLPFGGIKNSGLNAYHGKYSLDVFTLKKPVLNNIEYTKK